MKNVAEEKEKNFVEILFNLKGEISMKLNKTDLTDICDFLADWGFNCLKAIIVILCALLLIGAIVGPIYLLVSGIAKVIIWRIIVGAVCLIALIGLGITLDE